MAKEVRLVLGMSKYPLKAAESKQSAPMKNSQERSYLAMWKQVAPQKTENVLRS